MPRSLKAMPAKLVSDDGRHTVIRLLFYVAEDDLTEFEVIPVMTSAEAAAAVAPRL